MAEKYTPKVKPDNEFDQFDLKNSLNDTNAEIDQRDKEKITNLFKKDDSLSSELFLNLNKTDQKAILDTNPSLELIFNQEPQKFNKEKHEKALIDYFIKNPISYKKALGDFEKNCKETDECQLDELLDMADSVEDNNSNNVTAIKKPYRSPFQSTFTDKYNGHQRVSIRNQNNFDNQIVDTNQNTDDFMLRHKEKTDQRYKSALTRNRNGVKLPKRPRRAQINLGESSQKDWSTTIKNKFKSSLKKNRKRNGR